MRACSTPTPEGTLWPVDAALRPEGKQGPLVRTISSHKAYYERWAKTWEFQALLKAWVSAGDKEIGLRYKAEISPDGLGGGRAGATSSRTSRRCAAASSRTSRPTRPRASSSSAPVGCGTSSSASSCSSSSTAAPTRRCARRRRSRRSPRSREGGYVAREDAATLDEAYRRLRCLEHRIQLHRLRRTHLMPVAEPRPAPARPGHGPPHRPGAPSSPTGRPRRARCAGMHERLFYRPLLAAAAKLSPPRPRLSPRRREQRLAALGFRDPAGAMRHIEALTTGVSRRAAIQRTLLPVMLGWFADEADPDAGLLSFRRVSDAARHDALVPQDAP